MKQLIDAFQDLFKTTALAGGALAKTANFTLENVNWQGSLRMPEPTGHPVADAYLEATCKYSGPAGSSSHKLAEALWAATDQLEWRTSSKSNDDGPDIAILLRNFSVATIIGQNGLLPSDEVSAGFSLQAPDTYYPPHAHFAEESYWIIGGDADWRVAANPWFAVEPGDTIYHESEARHVMQTNGQALLTVWLWTSHLDSEVMIVRG